MLTITTCAKYQLPLLLGNRFLSECLLRIARLLRARIVPDWLERFEPGSQAVLLNGKQIEHCWGTIQLGRVGLVAAWATDSTGNIILDGVVPDPVPIRRFGLVSLIPALAKPRRVGPSGS